MANSRALRSSVSTNGPAQSPDPQGANTTRGASKPGPSEPLLRPQAEPELTLADIQRSITASSAAVCGKLDLLTAEVASIKRRQTELEDSVSMNSDLVANLQHVKLPAIEKKMAEKIADLEEKIVIMEIYSRRANLLFYGVNETPDEKVRDVLQKVFIHLGINEREANDIAIANALPPYQDATTELPPHRPAHKPRMQSSRSSFTWRIVTAYSPLSKTVSAKGSPKIAPRRQWESQCAQTSPQPSKPGGECLPRSLTTSGSKRESPLR